MTNSGVNRLERATRSPFTYLHEGKVEGLPSPLGWDQYRIRQALYDEHTWLPAPMPQWKARALFEAWRIHFDLPTSTDVERLVYNLDRWPDALEADFYTYAQLDLGELWRARKWRLMVNVMDHLPGHSFLASASAMDPEHAARMAEILDANTQGSEKSEDDSGPPLHTWTPEVAMLADVIDTIATYGFGNIQVHAGDKAGRPPKPHRRPKTALALARQKAQHDRKKRNHESLVARMLPHKAQSTD